MLSEIIQNAPIVRCYVCGEPTMAMVCHHCGRAMCEKHGPAIIQQGFVNLEFTDLGLTQITDKELGIHCRDCLHSVRSFRSLIRIGTIVIAITVAYLLIAGFPLTLWWINDFNSISSASILFCIGPAFTFLIVSIVAVLSGIYLRRSGYRKSLLIPPPLPVLGKIRSAIASELIHGEITLDSSGKYTSKGDTPNGSISLSLQFSPRDRDRFEIYSSKYKIPHENIVLFHAGFAVLKGAINLQFETPEVLVPGTVNTIALMDKIEKQPFLTGNGTGRNNQWNTRYNYSFETARKNPKLPIQLVPTFVREGDTWGLELVVQINPKAKISSLLTSNASIEELLLYAPKTLAKVEKIHPSALTGTHEDSDGQILHAITWKNVDISTGDRNVRYKTFYVRFENKIPLTTKLYGRLRMRFEGTLSGLEGINFFYPLGNKRIEVDTNASVKVSRNTYVNIDFNLDLGSLRFQEMTSVEKRITREGIVPDHRVLAAITNAISEHNIYVKRIIENPPRTSKAGAHIINRFWDIAGRMYDGVYPIDFHMVLTGEEIHSRTSRFPIGKTQFDITVQGMTTDQEMREQVYYLRDQLEEIIDDSLESFNIETNLESANLGEIFVDSSSNYKSSDTSPLTKPNVNMGRRTQIQERLDKLDDALLEGRITETRYQEMQLRYITELNELTSEN